MKQPLIIIACVSCLILTACSKKAKPTEQASPVQPVFSYQTYGCQDTVKSDSFTVSVQGHSVIVWHHNLFTNCCAVIKVYFRSAGDSLCITERDTLGSICYCLCHFPVSSRIDSLSSGQYWLGVYQQSFYDSIPAIRLLHQQTITIQ
ncbi:MAG: hypothetical protein QME74_08455 [Candidatus Edwardsbacteria bacterium]|nr:hypothetical protein [Candidatus Edwardsbacteria bacterium]